MADIRFDLENDEVIGTLPNRSSEGNFNFIFDFGNVENELTKSFTIAAFLTEAKRISMNAEFLSDRDSIPINFYYSGISAIPIHETLTWAQYQELENNEEVDSVKVYFISDRGPAATDLGNVNILSDTTKWNAINEAINLIQQGQELLSQG